MRKLTPTSPIVAWPLLVAGILATAYAWQYRHPASTSDFTLFYVSAQQTDARMFAHPPGPPRGNMNPPLFQLMLRPLTAWPVPVAENIWRILNVIGLAVCVWWLARSSEERWTAADYGILLAWAPMASTVSLNQLTWILWPLLLASWSWWRRDRWTAGAVTFGIVLSLKPFLGVFLLWLIVQRRWRAALVSMATAAAGYLIGVAVYGLDVTRAWIHALGDVTWAYAGMNASVQGMLTRALSMPVRTSTPLVNAAGLVRPLALAAGATIVVMTLASTRRASVDRSWTPLMVCALLASPLGWLYYIWWILPGTRPARLLATAPLLLVPMWALPITLAPSGWLMLTFGSVYFWGLFALWLADIVALRHIRTTEPQTSDAHEPSTGRRVWSYAPAPSSWFSVVGVVLISIVVFASAIAATQQSAAHDPAEGTWVLNRAKSSFEPPVMLASRTLTLTIVGDSMRQTTVTESTDPDRPQEQVQYIGRYDGIEISVPGAYPPALTMKKRDSFTIELTGKDGDEVVETGSRILSADHRTLTITRRGHKNGIEYRASEVYDRRQ